MKNIFLSLVILTLCGLLWSGLVWAEGFGSPVMDGVVDGVYGAAEASDPSGDGAGNANMDLLDLYVCNDASYWYFCFTINDDIGTTNWGKYAIYIDIDGIADSGADTSDAWVRNVRGINPHLPEYGLYSWIDQAPPYLTTHTQLWAYDDSAGSWTQYGNLDGVGLSAGTTSGIEWKIEKSRIMSPDSLWCEVWSTGGGDHDNARDTSNDPADDWNADPDSSWQQMAYIALSTLVHQSSGADTTKPWLEGAVAGGPTGVDLSFSEAMDTSAFNPGNYTIAGLSVTAAESLGVDGVRLTTSAQTFGVNYTVVVSSAVEDMSGNYIHPDHDEASFTGFGFAVVTFIVDDSADSVWEP